MGRYGRFLGHIAGLVLRLVCKSGHVAGLVRRLVCKLEGMLSLAMFPVSLLSLVRAWAVLVLLKLRLEAMMMGDT